jgi:hypothetical protein
VVFALSIKTGDGLFEFCEWLEAQVPFAFASEARA